MQFFMQFAEFSNQHVLHKKKNFLSIFNFQIKQYHTLSIE
jgi:hypothetical protein